MKEEEREEERNERERYKSLEWDGGSSIGFGLGNLTKMPSFSKLV